MRIKTPMILAIALAPLSAFAQTPASTQPASAPAITPVFDCFHINSAWGFSLAGKFIDSDGTIYSYRKTKSAWLPHEIVENGVRYLTEADLQAKYVEREKSGSIDAKTLADKNALIEAAANGKLVREDGGARDAGSSSCHAYIRDAAKARYRDIDLGSDGGVNDVRSRNDAAQAQDLLVWLKSVGVAR
jgi:hypothetical protein